MEDNLTSADPLSYKTYGSQVDRPGAPSKRFSPLTLDTYSTAILYLIILRRQGINLKNLNLCSVFF